MKKNQTQNNKDYMTIDSTDSHYLKALKILQQRIIYTCDTSIPKPKNWVFLNKTIL